ncbi:hypothetical protein [Croceicoccus gelatinilyticus]|uniref:hypothetical protein n=1 Tax=Croceicoccus gelatinilyticus TaxID=2835536 RepID=UPI001BD02FD9|nr:hypothetical protein [Croceicoccus gelatinilyticus]MBS7671741.1 hypothetical protein [Croceicoccus gelatinilyticus]
MTTRKLIGFQVTDAKGVNIMGDGGNEIADHPSFSVIPPEAAGIAALKISPGQLLQPIFEGDIEEPGEIGFAEAATNFLNTREEFLAETAACLWEAAQNLVFGKNYADLPEAIILKDANEGMGAAGLRMEITALAPACMADWVMLSVEQQDEAAPYDWEFVPTWLANRLNTQGL